MNKGILCVTVGGRELPCRLTMGAMLLYKRNMQKDVSQMSGGYIEELLMFMWCCVKCACKADGVDFEPAFEAFCGQVSHDDLPAWTAAMAQTSEDKKK